MDPSFGDLPVFFRIFALLVSVASLAIVALAVTQMLRGRRVLREAGLDPLAAGAQIAARLASGPLGARTRTLELRLAELDDLHARGVISDAEHATARAAALAAS